MNEDGRGGGRDGGRDAQPNGGDRNGGDRNGGDRGGPSDTQFLQLELSKVILAEAEGMARDAVRDVLREAIRDRLRERLGDVLQDIGRAVADAVADDTELNLSIEAQIGEHREQRRSVEQRVREALDKVQRGAKPAVAKTAKRKR